MVVEDTPLNGANPPQQTLLVNPRETLAQKVFFYKILQNNFCSKKCEPPKQGRQLRGQTAVLENPRQSEPHSVRDGGRS
jgi:hypothetical protein